MRRDRRADAFQMVASCSLFKFANVSEVVSASIIMAILEGLCTNIRKMPLLFETLKTV
jgi:hypothetical protein